MIICIFSRELTWCTYMLMWAFTFLCECLCGCTHACVGQMLSADAPLNPSPPSFLSLPLNPEHICLLEELANELQESTWARLPALGSQTCLLSGVDYLNFRPSCLHGRRFANWSISLDPYILKGMLNIELRVWGLHGHTLGAKAPRSSWSAWTQWGSGHTLEKPTLHKGLKADSSRNKGPMTTSLRGEWIS